MALPSTASIRFLPWRRTARSSPAAAGSRPGPGRLPAAAGEDRAVRRHGRNLMEAVDGNAIGGLLLEVFGTEMTDAPTVCASCGDARQVAELVVYLRGPGTVVRCRSCGNVLMVFVTIHDRTCVDLMGLASLG